MDKIKWSAVDNSKAFLDLIELNSVGLEKAKALYLKGEYDNAVYEYYLYSLEKFKNISWDIEEKENDIQDADLLLENKISLCEYEHVFVGDPIDWAFYPFDDMQWQSHLGYLYFPRCLLIAYKKTGDKKYIDKWNKIHMEFIENHPLGTEDLYYSKRLPMYKNEYLPVVGGEGFCKGYIGGSWISLSSRRVEDWLTAFVFLAKNNILDISTFCNLVVSIVRDHLTVIFNNPRKGTPNQFIHSSSIMISIGSVFWEAKNAPAAYLLGMSRLEEAIDEYCVLPDGTDIEQSHNYNLGLVYTFYNIYNNEMLKGNRRIEKLCKKIEKRCEYLAAIKDPLGHTPSFAKSQNHMNCPVLTDIEDIIKKFPQFEKVKKLYNAVKNGEGSDLSLYADFPYGGYSVMRDGWNKDSLYLFTKYSRYSPGHKHEDANSIDITAYGKKILIDSGNYNYSDDEESRYINHYMYSSAAHNTMDIDGLSQARTLMEQGIKVDERHPESTTNDIEYEKFSKIKKLHETECEGRRIHTDDFDMIEGIYKDGYYNIYTESDFLAGSHTRRTLFIKGLGFIIDDTIGADDDKEHTYYQHWIFGFNYRPEDIEFGDNSIRTNLKDDTNAMLLSFTDDKLKYSIKYGDNKPIGGWNATDYGHKIPTVNVNAEVKKAGKCRIITFIYPFKADPDVSVIKKDGIDFELKVNETSLIFKGKENGFELTFGDKKFEC